MINFYWILKVFSTSDRFLSDVLLLSKVREFEHFQCISGRPWEAVGGRGALIGSERSGTLWHSYLDLSEPIRAPRPPTASQIRPPTASHRFGLPQFVMWSLWANQGARPPTKVRDSASQTPGEAMRLAVKSVRRARGSYCLARSPIGLTDRTLKSVRPWESEHGLSPQSHVICFESPKASHGLPRPHRFGVRSEVRGHVGGRSALTHTGDAVILGAVWLISRLNALLRPVESDRPVCVRGRSASHMASHFTSDSQICETLWQIGLSDRSDRSYHSWQIDQMCHKSLISCYICSFF